MPFINVLVSVFLAAIAISSRSFHYENFSPKRQYQSKDASHAWRPSINTPSDSCQTRQRPTAIMINRVPTRTSKRSATDTDCTLGSAKRTISVGRAFSRTAERRLASSIALRPSTKFNTILGNALDYQSDARRMQEEERSKNVKTLDIFPHLNLDYIW